MGRQTPVRFSSGAKDATGTACPKEKGWRSDARQEWLTATRVAHCESGVLCVPVLHFRAWFLKTSGYR